jgi:uracil-DNA glycosylase
MDIIKLALETTDESWHPMFEDISIKLDKDINIINNKLSAIIDDGFEKYIYPKKENIFKAFSSISLNTVKVIILGQDPYHQKGQATGFAFDIPKGVTLPSSLNNIYKEIQNEFNIKLPNYSILDKWNEQGVLLLNTSLTVKDSSANSHKKLWKNITDYIIEYIDKHCNDYIVMLWGNNALSKKQLFKNLNNDNILISSHPSGLSYKRKLKQYSSFDGNNHFLKCNEILKEPIEWFSI